MAASFECLKPVTIAKSHVFQTFCSFYVDFSTVGQPILPSANLPQTTCQQVAHISNQLTLHRWVCAPLSGVLPVQSFLIFQMLILRPGRSGLTWPWSSRWETRSLSRSLFSHAWRLRLNFRFSFHSWLKCKGKTHCKEMQHTGEKPTKATASKTPAGINWYFQVYNA